MLEAVGAEDLINVVGPTDDAVLGRRVDRQPSLAVLSRDRGGVDDDRVFVLGGGLSKHRRAFAVEEEDRAEVDRELHVDVLGLNLRDRPADADAGVVDEHVEPAVALAVGVDDRLDLALVRDVDGQRLDVVAEVPEFLDGSLELLAATPGDGNRYSLPGDP